MEEETIGSVLKWYEEYKKQEAKNLQAAVEGYWIPRIIPEITRVVDKTTGRTCTVYKVLPGYGVQVWVKQRGNERENWPWSWIAVRKPRVIKRWPRPFRFARHEKSLHCHCKIGRMEVESVEERKVRCTRCKNLIGTESYPRRFERASQFLRKAALAIAKGIPIQKGVQGRTRKTSRSPQPSRKVGKSKSALGVQPKRRSLAKASVRKSPAKRRKSPAVPKNHKKVPKNKAKKVPSNKAKGRKGKPVKKKTNNVLNTSSTSQIQKPDPVHGVESIKKPDTQNDVPGSGGGRTTDPSGVLPSVS